MSNNVQYPINVKFNYNWDRIHRVFDRLVEKKNQGYFPSTPEPAYGSTIYSISKFGSIISSNNLTDQTWHTWNGPFLEWLLPPEAFVLKNQIIDAGINFVSFVYTCHEGSISEHIDGKRPGEATHGHCNLNYVISSADPTAKTTSKNPNGPDECYPSVPGSAWLIDTATPHQVINSGVREVFQLKFHSPFSEVKQFFINNNLGL
jgi:hypothetical protein